MKTIEINGIEFEAKTTQANADDYIEYANSPYAHADIFECYAKPSAKKLHIFNEWYEWMRNLNVKDGFNEYINHMRITSYNDFCFTIGALYFRDKKPFAILKITKAHNVAYIL